MNSVVYGLINFSLGTNSDRLKQRAIHAFVSGVIPNMFLLKISYWW